MLTDDGRVVVSNSTLKDVHCTQCDVLRHHHKLTGVDRTGARQAGVCVHEALSRYLKGMPAAEALAHFDFLYKDFSDRVCAPVKKIKDGREYVDENPRRHANVRIVLEEWLIEHPLSALPFTVAPGLVEVAFELPLPGFDNTFYRGRIDTLVEDDGLWVHEFKTTGRIDETWWRQWRLDSGISGYVWAVEQQLGERPRGAIVSALQTSEVPQSSRKCSEHGVPYAECGRMHCKWGLQRFERTPEQIKQWWWTMEGLANKHAANMKYPNYPEQEGMFTGACGKWEGFAPCDFREYCEAGRPREFSPELFGLEEVKAH